MTMTREPKTPEHGTLPGYRAGCRLPCCRAANRRSMNVYRMKVLQGAPLAAPAIGMVRRIQSLRAAGWSNGKLAAELGIPKTNLESLIYVRRDWCTMTTHRKVAELFERLSGTPGTDDRTRRSALARGHHPPMAWYGLDIDNPDHEPQREPIPRGFDLDDWEFIVTAGESAERAAERCGVSLAAVERAAYRAGRADLASIAASVRNHQRAEAT